MQLSRERIRFLLDQQFEDGARDVITGEIARAARGDDWQFEFGFGVTIQDVFALLDVSNFQVVTLTVKDAADRGGPTLMQKSIGTGDLNLTLTPEQWDAGTHQHGVIAFAGAETKLELGNSTEKNFYWSVVVTTSTGTTLTLGDGEIRVYTNGVSGEATVTPPLGSSLVPVGTTYSVAGAYVLNGLIVGLTYSWEKGANDTNLVNGTETLVATGYFKAQGTSVTLNGTISALITAQVRWPRIVMWDDLQAALAGLMKIINAPGVLIGMTSPDGKVLRLEGVDNNEMEITKVIRLAP
jgi:hypothetical protein